MTDAIEQASAPRRTHSPPETAFESQFTGEPSGTHKKHHTLDHAFAMEATSEDINREREYLHRHEKKPSSGEHKPHDVTSVFSFEATKSDLKHEEERAAKHASHHGGKSADRSGTGTPKKHHEHHEHPKLDKVVQAMFDPHPTPEAEAAMRKSFEKKQHEHEEHERAKAERRKSHEAHGGHQKDLNDTFSFEATKKDREHEEEKARKRKSIERKHGSWGLDIPKFWKRHEKCEENPECVVPAAEKEHEKEECPHA